MHTHSQSFAVTLTSTHNNSCWSHSRPYPHSFRIQSHISPYAHSLKLITVYAFNRNVRVFSMYSTTDEYAQRSLRHSTFVIVLVSLFYLKKILFSFWMCDKLFLYLRFVIGTFFLHLIENQSVILVPWFHYKLNKYHKLIVLVENLIRKKTEVSIVH